MPEERRPAAEARERFHQIEAGGIRLVIDLEVGHLRVLEIERNGRRLTPLYTAPWVDDPSIVNDSTLPPNLRLLSGDFFCAPFGNPDDDEVPSHGWPANSRWDHVQTLTHAEGGTVARYALRKRPRGARLVKELTLRDGHPFVYQRHIFEGGSGAISVASHAMTHFSTSGRLSFSPKAYAETAPRALEDNPARGRSILAYPSRSADLGAVPLASGGKADLQVYPIGSRHEDFVMLVEHAASRLGWAAALREDEDDIVLSLKHPRDLPITMLWFSNGGRNYPPWNGRNVGVLGIEEGRAWSASGFAAALAPNPLSASGVPTVLTLDPAGAVEVRHVIGGLPRPAGWTEIGTVNADHAALVLTEPSGGALSVPYDAGFLAREAEADR